MKRKLESDGQITMKRTAIETSDFWKVVDEQEKKYGSVETLEVNWGEDVGSENFD